MRFDPGILLLGLIALGILPEVSTRVLHGYPSQVAEVEQRYNATATNLPRAAPIAPLKPAHLKPPTAPGDKTPNGEPDPLVPGGDKTPDAPGDKTPDGPPRLGQPANKDKDGPGVCKRMNPHCSARRRRHRNRGSAILDDIHNGRRERDGRDHAKMLDERYQAAHADFEDSLDDAFNSLDMGRHGFSMDRAKWDHRTVHSRRPKVDNNGQQVTSNGALSWIIDEEPILSMSHSRVRRNDKVIEGLVTHQAYADRDRNRFELTDSADPIHKYADGNPIPRPNWKQESMPVHQMMHESYKRSQFYWEDPPDEYYFAMENVANRDSEAAIRDALAAIAARTGHEGPLKRATLRRLPDDPVMLEHFETLAGNDNSYFYLNMVRHHDRYDDFDVEEIEVSDDPLGLGIRMVRRPQK